MLKVTNDIRIADVITHGATFHADEVLATVILSKLFGNITVCRTFSITDAIPSGAIVYDTGYGKYDHHQKGGNGSRENGVPYATAGLIWRDFGPQLVADTCNPELVWSLVDRNLIQGVDAADNGKLSIQQSPKSMSFSNVISQCNPNWDCQISSDEAFVMAYNLAKIVFENALANATSKAKAQGIVDEAISRARNHIMVLDSFVPWQEFIFLSTNSTVANEILYVVFPSNRGGYNWQCVPAALGSFSQRKGVPEEWKGLNGPDLQKVTGVPSATFCHPAGFIGGATTLEGAIALAKLAVES